MRTDSRKGRTVVIGGARVNVPPRVQLRIEAALLSAVADLRLTWPEKPDAEIRKVAANVIFAYLMELMK
jgi:hypothetical protein